MKKCFVWLFSVIFFYYATTGRGESEVVIIRHGADQSCVFDVIRNNRVEMVFDLKDYVPDRDPISYFYKHTPPLSPDGRYAAFVSMENFAHGPHDCYLLLLDTDKKNVQKLKIYEKEYYGEFVDIKWLNNYTVIITQGATPRQIIYDINTKSCRVVNGLYTLAVDANGNNYCHVWERIRSGRISERETFTLKEQRGDFIRYNGYWVYPKPIAGFIDYKGYMNYYDRPSIYPIIKDPNYNMDKHYLFSKPVFIGETNWAAFVEQVYPVGEPKKIVETNFVLIDASKVKENPPDPTKISVFKKRQYPIVVKPELDYAFLMLNMETRWNPVTKSIELWDRGYYGSTKKNDIKIIEATIDMNLLNQCRNPFAE